MLVGLRRLSGIYLKHGELHRVGIERSALVTASNGLVLLRSCEDTISQFLTIREEPLMAIELRCKTCSNILPTANKLEEQVTVCTDCAKMLVAASEAAFASTKPEKRQDLQIPLLPADQENPYQPYVASQGLMELDFHSTMHPVQNTVPTFGNIFSHAVTVWKANLWMMIAVTLITFFVIPIGFNIASGWVQGLVNSVGNPVLAIIFVVISTLAAIILPVFLGIGSTKFFIQVLRGGPADLGMLFQGGNRLLPVLGLSILWGIEPIGGVFVCYFLANINPVFCAVVGLTFFIFFVVLFQWFWPSYYLVVDRRTPVIESLRLAKEITKGNNGNTCYVFLVGLVLGIFGLQACGVGLLLSMPLGLSLWVSAYLMFSRQIAPAGLAPKSSIEVS